MFTIKKGRLFAKDMRYGGKSSYTNQVKYAVKYETAAEAKKHVCGNERIVKLTLKCTD